MKKLISSLIISTIVLIASASATQLQTTKGGPYVGVTVGCGTTKARVTAQPSPFINGLSNTSTGLSNTAANFGLLTGYGWIENQLYWGGEVGYSIDNTHINNTFTTMNITQSLRRSGYFHASFLMGYLYTPMTMVYARLGMIKSNWKAVDNQYTYGPMLNGSTNRASLAPGLGFELNFKEGFSARLEYIQNFIPSVSATNPNDPTQVVKFDRIINQSLMFGLTRKL